VGNAGTGKSGVLNRYVHQKFDQNTQATVAVDFTNRFTRLDVLDKITNRLTKLSIKVQVWDVGSRYYARSKERYVPLKNTNSIKRTRISDSNSATNCVLFHCRLCDKANGVMIVLDICDMSSLNQLGDYFSVCFWFQNIAHTARKQ
jgi:GTPase SAR1 family protein